MVSLLIIFLLLLIIFALLTIQLVRLGAVILFRPAIAKRKYLAKVLSVISFTEWFLFSRLSVLSSPWDDEDSKVRKVFKQVLVIWIILLVVLALIVYQASGFRNVLRGSEVNNSNNTNFNLFDQTKWAEIGSMDIAFGNDFKSGKVLLLKSLEKTGESGTGDALYDVNLVIARNNTILYDYSRQRVKDERETDPNRYYIDNTLLVKDVTGDGSTEIIFHSGFMGASDWVTLEHVMRHDKQMDGFADIRAENFYAALNHGIKWVGTAPVVAEAIESGTYCHGCPKRFKYTIYQWSSNTFVASKSIEGKKLYEGAEEAFQNDMGFINATNL